MGGGGEESENTNEYRTMKVMYKWCVSPAVSLQVFLNEVSLKQSEKRSREVESVCHRNKMIGEKRQ